MSLDLLNKTNDRVFKEMFIRNKSSMIDFLKCILEVSNDQIEDLEFVDTHSRKGAILGGESIIDMKVKTAFHVIDVEMQVKRSPAIKQRIILYLANMIKDQNLGISTYTKMKKTVSILIAAEHDITDDDRYFHKYHLKDEKDGSLFTDLLEVNVLELRKLPDKFDGSPLWNWLAFLKTNNEENMKILAEKNNEIKKMYETLADLSTDEAERHAVQQHEMYLIDKYALLHEGQEKIAKSLLHSGMDVKLVAKHTNLPIDEVEKLQNS